MRPGRFCVRRHQADDLTRGRGSSSEQRCCGHSDTGPRHHPHPPAPAVPPCLCVVYTQTHRQTHIHTHSLRHRTQTSPSPSSTSCTPLPMCSLHTDTQTNTHTLTHSDTGPKRHISSVSPRLLNSIRSLHVGQFAEAETISTWRVCVAVHRHHRTTQWYFEYLAHSMVQLKVCNTTPDVRHCNSNSTCVLLWRRWHRQDIFTNLNPAIWLQYEIYQL